MWNVENVESYHKIFSGTIISAITLLTFFKNYEFANLNFLKDKRKNNALQIKIDTLAILEKSLEEKEILKSLKSDINHEIKCITFGIKPKLISPFKIGEMGNVFYNEIKECNKYTISQFMNYHNDAYYPNKYLVFKTRSDYAGFIIFLILSILLSSLYLYFLWKLIFIDDSFKTILMIIIIFICSIFVSKVRRDLWKSIKDKKEFNKMINSKKSM